MNDTPMPYDQDEEHGARADQAGAETTPFEIDVYGVKLKTELHPRPPGDPDPKSWAEVWKKVNEHLMAFVANFFGGLPDTVKTYRSVVRGLGGLSDSMNERIARSHEIADSQEAALQVEAHVVEPLSPDEALANAELIFARLQAKGVKVTMHQLPDGQWTVIAVRPELEEAAEQAILDASPRAMLVSQNLIITDRAEAFVVRGAPQEEPPQEEGKADTDIAEAMREDESGDTGSLG